MTRQIIFGACPHDCPDTCGVVTEVEDGKAVDFYAAATHPITANWLCAKVRPYLNHVYHPERLLYPLRRVGPKGSGQWTRITWAEAIGEIVSRWQAIIAAYGAEAILPYSYSGTLGLVQMGVSSTRLWNRLGASQLERTICGAAAEMAVEMTLGVRQSQSYQDIQHSQLVLIWGHNPVTTAPHFMPHLKAAQRNGTKVVVIDPRKTKTAKGADWHLAPKPGTDGALALGLAHLLVREGWADEAWLAQNTVGWSELRPRLADYPPERVAEITGLPVSDIEALAQLYGTTRPGLIKIADGVQRNVRGGQTIRAICALPAITGQYGTAGGGLAYSTSGYFAWDNEAMGHEMECPPPGRSVNMNRLGAALLGEVADPPIQSLFVFGANPAASTPHSGAIIAGLQREDLFTVVHELFMTDTADQADIVLPATSQLEQADLHKAYGHTHLTYNAPAIAPLGECKSNWELMRLLAAALGFTETWLQHSEDEAIAEILAATAANNPAFQGITLERLKTEHTVALNLPGTIPFADGYFPTPSGKVELYCERLVAMGVDPLPGYEERGEGENGQGSTDSALSPQHSALFLISAAAHHFVSSSLANQPGLLRHEGEPFVEIHPQDAAAHNIQSGDRVRLENEQGWCELKAVVTENVRAGVVASPKGRWQKLSRGRNINWLTSDELADLAGQSTFHSTRVWLRPSNRTKD
ncbi:MAG: molybdopterin oxidoreductase family protein [Chloroflexi bacterium]|nr:molybdopterin oxidoreductase family protein [Chloroflexota bacterium]